MYKNFHQNINNFSLMMGNLNLLRSFYFNEKNGDDSGKEYENSDQAVTQFKAFCQKVIAEVEKALLNSDYKIDLTNKELELIKNSISSIEGSVSNDIIKNILENLDKVNCFTEFLITDFSNKDSDPVDLREIKSLITILKYQTYLS